MSTFKIPTGEPHPMHGHQHIPEFSHTSRTMAEEKSMMEQEQATKKAVNAVLKKPHKIHQRNQKRKVAYFQRRDRIGWGVSF